MAGKVGFIGLGAMGGPMALNLAKAGHKLVVHDIDQSKTAAVRAQGAELAGNAEAVAAAVDRTILIVETTDQAQSVIAGERGIIAFTRKLAFELGPDGINVNAIAPSITLTERIRPHWDKRSQASQAEEIERTPLRRVAEAADQANVICFLASSDADFVTGLTIDVTGGV